MLTGNDIAQAGYICFVLWPVCALTAVYAWDKGMDLIVPMSRYQIMRRALRDRWEESDADR